MVRHGTFYVQSPNGSFVLVIWITTVPGHGGGALAVMPVTIQSSTSYLFFKVPGGFLICLQNPTWPKSRPSTVCIWPKGPPVYLATDVLMCLGIGVVPDPSGGITEHAVYGPYYFSQVWKMNSQTSGPRGPGKGLADMYCTVLRVRHFSFLWGVLVWLSSREKSALWMQDSWQQRAWECRCTEICFSFSWILP